MCFFSSLFGSPPLSYQATVTPAMAFSPVFRTKLSHPNALLRTCSASSVIRAIPGSPSRSSGAAESLWSSAQRRPDDSVDTISYLCGECHAKFHPNAKLGGISEVGLAFTAGWHKHPTDIAFYTVRGGFAGSEYQQYVSYSLEAPVAFFKPEGKETKVDENSIVMCLSCHRAHASPYPDILRWDYPEMNTRTSVAGRGCMVCHTRKGKGTGRLD